jgi:serine protease Do
MGSKKVAILVTGAVLAVAGLSWYLCSTYRTTPAKHTSPSGDAAADFRRDAESKPAQEWHPQAIAAEAADPRSLQERIYRTIKAVQPTVVAVKNPKQAAEARPARHESGGSGVIITPEGLVLSQYHVSHRGMGDDSNLDFKPGDKTTVILSDGRECLAELLGGDRAHDLSLLRLLPPGPYPHVSLDPEVRVQRGDWLLKLGHPMSYRRDRSAPVRLGRVVCCVPDAFVSDCQTTSGDSGGPYFDLDGRLAGVIGIATGDLQKILPKDAELAQRFDQLIFSCTSSPRIHAQLEAMLRGEVRPIAGRRFLFELPESEQLPADNWTQGMATRAKFCSTVARSLASVVTVLNDEVPVALGTVISAEGWIVTKASELPAEPKCRLPDRKVVEARVVGVDLAFDVALLKVERGRMQAVTWADTFKSEAGTLLAAIGSGDLPLAVGVVSVPRRNLTDATPPKYSLPLRVPAAPPAIYGKEVGGGLLVAKTRGLALTADLRPGDLLQAIDGRPLSGHQDLVSSVKGRLTGDRLAMVLSRGRQTLEISLPLQSEEAAGGRSYRADDFPTVFEHDLPLFPHECGGPLVDQSGRAIGITIARVGMHGCMAIPGDCVLQLIPDLQSGKLAEGWRGPEKSGAR